MEGFFEPRKKFALISMASLCTVRRDVKRILDINSIANIVSVLFNKDAEIYRLIELGFKCFPGRSIVHDPVFTVC